MNNLIPKSLKLKIQTWINKHSTRKCEYVLSFTEKSRLHKKRVLVTGATGALGSAICLRLACEGAIVGVCGRDINKINELISRIYEVNSNATLEPIILDVLDDTNIEDSINSFVNKYGHIDALINNAGGGPRDDAKELYKQDISLIDSIINTNLRGTLLCCRIVSKFMIEKKKGKIINLGSVMGMCGMPMWSDYSSSKAAIIGLTKSLALELGKYNINVNCVSPGAVIQTVFDGDRDFVPTTMNALGRWGRGDEVASLIVFLISDQSDYITGQNIAIDGGRSLGLK